MPRKILLSCTLLIMTFLLIAQAVPSCEETYTIKQGNITIGKVTAFTYASGDETTCSQNYGFSSDSAHPKYGPTLQDSVAQFWLFKGTDGLCLFSVFGLEVTTSEGTATIDYLVSGNGTNTKVILQDDSGELTEPSTDVFKGRWSWGQNTDGGVIGPFAGSDWTTQIDIQAFTGSIQAIAFTSGNGIPIPISVGQSTITVTPDF